MRFRLLVLTLISLVFLLSSGMAQNKPAVSVPKPQATTPKKSPADARKQFAVDVVRSAVALPQPDQQDRLRVLASASAIIMPLRPSMAKTFSREGLRIEQELIQSGVKPPASMIESGKVDCAAVQGLVENVPVDRIDAAEQTLIGAVTRCPKTVPTAQRLIDQALTTRVVAPRLTVAVVDQIGIKSGWSQQAYDNFFASLPDAEKMGSEAPNYANMYAHMAPEVDRDIARKSGVKLLEWLNKVKEGGPKNFAINVVTGAMKETLGEQAYSKALSENVVAQQVAQNAGQPGEVEQPEEENVSVLGAISNASTDRTAELSQMQPSLRAREAAASGFATGTSGNRKLSDRYFDIAFSALNDVWDKRSERTDAPAVVQEVGEAAAQVDPVAALKRAQALQDPTAQALGMLAIARVVAASGNEVAEGN